MGDQTPALARATEAVREAAFAAVRKASSGDPSFDPLSTAGEYARAAMSAALRDPDDPESLWLYGAAIDAAAASLGTTLLTESYIVAVRAAVDAVRAAILGEQG